MNLYELGVHIDDFDYDAVEYVVAIARDEEEAIRFARSSRDVRWVVKKIIKLDGVQPQFISEYYRHG